MTMITREQGLELALLSAKVVERRLQLKSAESSYKTLFVAVCQLHGLAPEEWTIHVHSDEPTMVHLVHASSMPPEHPLAMAYAANQKEIGALSAGDFDQDHPEGGADLGNDESFDEFDAESE